MLKYFLSIIILIIVISPINLYAQFLGTPVEFLSAITEDEESKKLSYPSNVLYEPIKKEIYIIDGRGRILIYNSEFFPLYTLEKGDGVESPQGIAIDKEGNLYVTQSPSKENPNGRVSVFDVCMNLKREIILEGFEGSEKFTPNKIAVDETGNLYLLGNPFPGIVRLSNDGSFIDIISPQENGKKIQINGITIDLEGNIYLISEEESHIYVYDKKGRFLFRFGEKGGCTGKLSRPQAVAIDNKNDRIYVVDYMRHSVTTYDRFGKYIFEFGGLGWGEGWFQYPKDVAVDNEGRIIVADTFNDRIQILKVSELFIQQRNLAKVEGNETP